MPPSASKQKRLAEKAAKQAAKGKSDATTSGSTDTPNGSVNGSKAGSKAGSTINTPLTSMSAATSSEDLTSMAKLQIATDRCVFHALCADGGRSLTAACRSAAGVLVSDPKGRDIKMDSYTLSFHGRLLIEGAEVSLNYGQRYGLLGENGSGKVSSLAYSSCGLDAQCSYSRLSCNLSLSEILKSLHISIYTLSAVKLSLPISMLSTSLSLRQKQKLPGSRLT